MWWHFHEGGMGSMENEKFVKMTENWQKYSLKKPVLSVLGGDFEGKCIPRDKLREYANSDAQAFWKSVFPHIKKKL